MDKKKNQKETFIKVLKYVKKYWIFVDKFIQKYV